MGVFTFVCKSSGGKWSAKQYEGDVEASADCAYDLERKLVQEALSRDSSGAVQSNFSLITPTSGVFQVVIGGASAGSFVASSGGGAAASSGGASAAEAPAAEEKKEEKEESDDDMGFSLFD
ncbi:hypothetical protein MKX03_025119 [Papaver bracteatum]|nr:hypothetical protein MKX03_025119 [Papaver bracteatum]